MNTIHDTKPGAQWARGAGGVFVIRSAAVLLAFVTQLLVARFLGPDGFGQFVFTISALGILASMASLGVPQTTVRYVPDYLATEKWGPLAGFTRWSWRVTLLSSTLLGGLMAAGVLVFRERIPEGLWQALLLAAAICPFGVFFAIHTAQLRALKRVWMATSWEMILRPLIFLALLVGGIHFAGLAATSASAIGANLAATVAAAVVVALFAHASLRRISKPAAPENLGRAWLRTSVLFIMLAAFNEVMMRTPVLALGTFSEMADAGIFGAANAIAGLVAFALTASNAMLAPMVSQLYAEKRKEDLQRVVTLAARWTTLVTLLLLAGVVIAGRFALSLYNPIFTQGYTALLILAGGQLANALCGPVGILLTMTGHGRHVAKVLGISALLNVALCAALIPPLGLLGGALAAGITVVLWNLALLWLVVKLLGIWPALR